MCKLLPSNRYGVPWPTSEHDFTFYTLVAFSSDALFQAFVRHTTLKPTDGTNPLVYTAYFGKTEHARVLISRGADVNHPGLVVDDIDTDSSAGDGTGTDESDEDNSDADTENSDVGNTADRRAMPLEVAVEHWHAEMIDLLLAEGSIVPDQLLMRVLTKQPDEYPLYIIKRLLQTAAFEEWAVTSWNNQHLLEAIVECEGDDPEQNGVGDLVMCVQRLVEVGCAQNISGETILHIAAEKGCIHAVKRLLSTNTILPLDIISFALRGASPERVDTVRFLIRHGADANPLAVNGDTPLHIAIKSSDEIECLRITQILVEAGSDPCRPDADDRPPIHLAMTRGFVSVVEYLLEKGVPLPCRILFAATQATIMKRDKMVRLLIRKGANLHVLDHDTLLQVAVSSVDEYDSLEIAKIIVDAGYKPSSCNLRDEAPLHLTVINKYLLSSLPSEDIFSALAYPPSRAQILAFILGKVDGTRSVEGNKYTLQDIAQRLTNNPDRCLRAAEVFISIQHNLSSWNYGAVLAALFDNAVAHGSFSTVEYLLSQDIPLPPGILFSALSLEARSANEAIKMLSFLVTAGADPRVLGANGNNLLHVAVSRFSIERQCFEVTKTLIEAGCNPSVLNAEGHAAIQIAVTRGFFDVVEYLLSLDVPLHCNILFSVLGNRNPQTIQMTHLLVAKGADVHAIAFDGASLVHVAMRSFDEHECLQLTRIFARVGSNLSTLDAQGEPPIQIALNREFAFVVEYLLLKGVPFPWDIFFVIFQWQKRHIYPDVARFTSILLCRGADVNVLAPNGDGLLHAAIRFCDQARCFNVTRLIITAGCSTSVLNADGMAPIQLAVNREFFSVAEYLLLKGATLPPDILLTLFENQHDSIRKMLRIVAFLVRKGANVHARTAAGDTPLHVALAQRHQVPSYATRFFLLEIVKLLVKAGGNPHAHNALGRTPFDLAVTMGYHEIVRYLRLKAPVSKSL
ncbi:ankyrin repeat-containing domain protein [Lanmaoa asiatica]|nr:ankyrin repeat-containing domain protein [Lanmaoa asiatica]